MKNTNNRGSQSGGKQTSKNSANMMVVELSTYEQPVLVESYNDDEGYITYGPNNSYFTYINECYIGSSTNRAVVNSIGQMIYGKGLDFIGSESKESTLLEIKKLLSPKTLRLLAMDFKQYGQCAIQVGYDKAHSKIVKTQHQPIMTLAKGKMDDKGNITKYWYSADWSNIAMYTPKPIPAFGTSSEQVEILYIGNYTYSSGLLYYDNIDYQSALQYCKAESEISNFHINNIQNGFSPSMLLTFKDGKPSAPEQMAIENKVKAKWGGSSKAGSIMIAFVDAGEDAPTMEAIQLSDADKQYQFVSEEAQNKILVSHRVTSPLLIGIKDATGLGGSNADELIASYKLFNTAVITPFQEILLDGINEILTFNGIVEDTYFVPLYPIDFIEGGLETTTDKAAVEKETGVVQSGTSTQVTETVTQTTV